MQWAGSKQRTLKHISELLPRDFHAYYEPFVGGGTLLLYLLDQNVLTEGQVFANDISRPLIATFNNIKSNVEALIQHSEQEMFSAENSKVMYQVNRSQMNKLNRLNVDNVHIACLFIFLMATCYNGVYQENLKGEFNTPNGIYRPKRVLFNKDLLREASHAFRNYNVTFSSVDYVEALKDAQKGDFVFLDPPYEGCENSYAGVKFNRKEQERVRDVFRDLCERGCFVLLMNSCTDYIKELYAEYKQVPIPVIRTIGKNTASKKIVKYELAILNY